MPSCLTQTEAKAVWEYRDGKLYWKIQPGSRARIGDEAGHMHGNGYRNTMYKKRYYGVHQLIYLIHHGYIPENIDHIDGNPLNNRIENLRPADFIRNGHNRKISANNTSGVKNVSQSVSGKWKVMLLSKGKMLFYGLVHDLELAALVASEARDKYHGEFARHK